MRYDIWDFNDVANHKVAVPTEPVWHPVNNLCEHTKYVLFDYVDILCHNRDSIIYEQI